MNDQVHTAVSNMEDDVLNVTRWGRLLVELGSGTSMVDPNTCWIIGRSLLDLGGTLKNDWEVAHDATRGQS